MAHQSDNDKRILIVDADTEMSAVLKARFEAAGFLAECARTGKEALDRLEQEWVDLIVMEIVLEGGINGFQLFKTIRSRENFRDIPVIIHSGKPAMEKTFELIGVDAYFNKPYSVDMLVQEARDILTSKVLILAGSHEALDKVSRSLPEDQEQFHREQLTGLEEYYRCILSNRYQMVFIQDEVGGEQGDSLAHLMKGSVWNNNTPVVIFSLRKSSELSEDQIERIDVLKKRCDRLGICHFVKRERLDQDVRKLTEKYLTPRK